MVLHHLQLTTTVDRRFGWRTSIAGHIMLFVSLAGALGFTIYTRARTTICVPYTASSDEFAQGNCTAATIYAGQSFNRPDATFQYTAATSALFERPENLTSCELLNKDVVRVQVYGLPASTPVVHPNVVYICNPPGPGENIVSLYSGRELGKRSVVLRVEQLQIGTRGDELWKDFKRVNNRVVKETLCYGEAAPGWEVYVTGMVAYMSSNATGPGSEDGTCVYMLDDTRVDINSPINEEIRRLASKGNDQIIEDLHRRLSPLPDVLFPCQACRQEWLTASEAPWVLWFTVIALLTVYRASYPVVARVMDWMEPENKRIYEREHTFIRHYRNFSPISPASSPSLPAYPSYVPVQVEDK